MTTANSMLRTLQLAAWAIALTFISNVPTQAAVWDISSEPLLSTTSGAVVLPNLMFMLDDSGSMDWDYMPDDAKNFSGKYGFNANHCNGVYYDPNTVYLAPAKSDGTRYPDANFSAAWNDGYSTGLGTTNLNTSFTGGSGSGASGSPNYLGPAFYYTYTGTQTTGAQMDFHNTSSTFYTECNSGTISSATPAPTNSVFTLSRLASVPTTTITVNSPAGGAAGATITIGSSGSTSVSSIKVGPACSTMGPTTCVQILSGTTTSSSTKSTVANRIVTAINNCTSTATGSCTATGYSASIDPANGSRVIIVGPSFASGLTPAVTNNGGGMSFTTTAFPPSTATSVGSITVNGVSLLLNPAYGTTPGGLATDISSEINAATGFSGRASGNVLTLTGPTSASTYTPVITVSSGTMTLSTQAFPESTPAKLQNFANWYSYYSTRMKMMKTGVGNAFKDINSNYRVGFMTMNNNTYDGSTPATADIVDIAPFVGGCAVGSGTCQKDKWYTKLYASIPGNSTPLREALSHVGQLYAHKFGTINTYTATITIRCASGSTGACPASNTTGVDSIIVNAGSNASNYSGEIMDCAIPASGSTCPSSSNTNTLATQIAAQINAMITTSFGASASGNVVTITGVASSPTPVVSNDFGGMTFTTSAFTTHTTTAMLNGITPADPMQYSCQQNFVILSTDGYWNGSTTYKLDNTTVGNQDGVEARPLYDGANAITTIVTPYTTTQRRQTITSGNVTNNTWTKSTASIGSSCTASAVNPSSTTSASLSDTSNSNFNIKVGLALSSSNPASGSDVCYQLSSLGTSMAWMCRGAGTSGTATSPANNNSTAGPDSYGITWKLVSNTSGNTGCITDRTAFGNTTSTSKGACPSIPAIAAGKNITTTPYTQTETITAANSTSLYDYTAPQTTTQTITNGVAGSVEALTPATLTYSLLALVSTTPGTATDVCSGQNGLVTACPNTGGVWTAGTVSGPTCIATASLPSAGTTYAITASNTITGTTGGATVVSTSAPVAGSPTSTLSSSGGTSDTLADVAEYYYTTDLRDNSLSNCTGALGSDVCTDNLQPTAQDPNIKQHMATFTLGLGARGRMVYNSTYGNLTSACNLATDGDYCAIWKGATASSSVCTWQTSGTTCNWPTPSSGAIENIDDLWHAATNGRGLYFSATDPTTLDSGLSSALTGIKTRLSAASASATSTPNITQTDKSIFSSTYLTGKWTGEVTANFIDPLTGLIMIDPSLQADPVSGLHTIVWTAQSQLDTLAQVDCASKAATPTCVTPDISTSRHIYTFDGSNTAGNNLKDFLYPNLTVAEKTYFDNKCTFTLLTQCSAATLTAGEIASGNLGTNLVNYLRGNQSLEPDIYRGRDHLLGDTVNAKPAYVKLPLYSFNDNVTPSYSAYKSAQAARKGVLYMGSNDGMLHAFYTDPFLSDNITRDPNGGKELWAYVPRIVMPNLYLLADQSYGNTTATPHQYFVDGSPETMDIFVATATNNLTVGWHTILVGGLGHGGKGFYALDVTDPYHPKALWEICDTTLCAISDPDMGYSYGNPVITKRNTDNRWVVLVTSGYNNGGTGMGTLYTLDAVTGAVLYKTTTGAATNPPSGLSKLSPWIDSLSTNFTTRFAYGGDLNGNLWRFDLGAAGANIAPTVTRIASLVDGSGATQSVTTRVELGDPLNSTLNSLSGTGTPAIFVATGRYLGLTDLPIVQVQSVYGIKDDLSRTTLTTPSGYIGNPRAPNTGFASFVKQYIYQPSPTTRTTSQYPVSWSSNQGWYADFVDNYNQVGMDGSTSPGTSGTANTPVSPSPTPGERVNIDPQLINGSLVVVTNIPDTNACSIGGTSWLYSFNFLNGQYVATADNVDQIVGQKLGNALTAGIVTVRLAAGKIKALVTDASGNKQTTTPPTVSAGATRRTSWRELIQ